MLILYIPLHLYTVQILLGGVGGNWMTIQYKEHAREE